MNYLAHGIRFLNRPYFLAGTATPDWLSVADRRVRLRERGVRPFLTANSSDDPTAEFAAGVLQHLHDDRWFHATRGFFEVTAHMTLLFREQFGTNDRFRASFLGHIATELLLDRVLDERYPGRLDTYYTALREVDPGAIGEAVNQMARGETRRLSQFVRLFLEERFLYDYRRPERLVFRLNQVMLRVRLPSLPDRTAAVLEAGADVVGRRWCDLLPASRFPWSACPDHLDEDQTP